MPPKTTDNQEEIFDVVSESDVVIGTTTRKEANSNKNLIHRSVYVVVFNTKDELFMQQRSNTKDTDPNKWTISCTGHVRGGDNYKRAAERELREELGIKARLIYIDKFIVRFPHETEMTALYKANSDGPFVLNPEEIKQGRFWRKDELTEAVERKKINLAFTGKVALEKLGWI